MVTYTNLKSKLFIENFTFTNCPFSRPKYLFLWLFQKSYLHSIELILRGLLPLGVIGPAPDAQPREETVVVPSHVVFSAKLHF